MVSAAFKYCTSPTSVFILILSLYDTQAAILLPPLLLFLLLVVAAARHLRLHGGLCGDNAEKEHISHRLPQVSTVQVAYWEWLSRSSSQAIYCRNWTIKTCSSFFTAKMRLKSASVFSVKHVENFLMSQTLIWNRFHLKLERSRSATPNKNLPLNTFWRSRGLKGRLWVLFWLS